MGFWDDIKKLFVKPPSVPSSSPWAQAVNIAVANAIASKQTFTPISIAQVLLAGRPTTIAESKELSDLVRAFCSPYFLKANGYEERAGTYLPTGTAPAAPPPGAAPTRASAPKPAPPQDDAYEAPAILSLSPEETRRRSLLINPMQTAWIGRIDTIPPQSDERTALIDRGLVLRGLLTNEDLQEIHRVGDLWIKHRLQGDAQRIAAQQATRGAIEQLRADKAAVKAEKQRLAKERAEQRAKLIAERKQLDIIYLGAGVSSRLEDRRSNVETLQRAKLPVLSHPSELASALGISVPRLRWLAFHSEAVTRPHYVYFEVPKRSGGKRLLSAPRRDLATAQRWVLQNILARLPTGTQAHGFVPERSTLTNARPHVGQDVVVNLDLSAFFPSITFERVRGLYQHLGYSPAVATILALLCTESPRMAADYDGQRYWVATAPRSLPQGACTSPALSNQIVRKLDRRLTAMAGELGWQYTRYADDLTFSAPPGKRNEVGRLMAKVRHIAEEEGFQLNPRKGRVQKAGGRQTVTGIVVNDKPSLAREDVRRLRAILHGARKTGLAAQNREGLPHFESWLKGMIAYLSMVDPDRGFAMMRELEALQRTPQAAAG